MIRDEVPQVTVGVELGSVEVHLSSMHAPTHLRPLTLHMKTHLDPAYRPNPAL